MTSSFAWTKMCIFTDLKRKKKQKMGMTLFLWKKWHTPRHCPQSDAQELSLIGSSSRSLLGRSVRKDITKEKTAEFSPRSHAAAARERTCYPRTRRGYTALGRGERMPCAYRKEFREHRRRRKKRRRWRRQKRETSVHPRFLSFSSFLFSVSSTFCFHFSKSFLKSSLLLSPFLPLG